MLSKILLVLNCYLASALVQAGFSGTRLPYGAVPFTYKANFGPAYAVAAPVPSSRGVFPYNAFPYSAPSFFKLHGKSGVGVAAFDCGPTLRSRPKFAFPAPVPAIYDVPLPADDGFSDQNYDGFEVPNIVVKFGPPITTTTTTYATSAAAATGVHVRTAFKAANGW